MDLLPENLKEGITPSEERLLKAVQKGNFANFRSGDKEIDKPENADKWGNERIIRSEILYWLCTNPNAIQKIHTKGIRLWGAKITGFIDYDGASIPHTLIMINCFFEENISFMDTKTKTINLSGSHVKSFTAVRANIEGTLFLKDVISTGEVRLRGANINGDLNCTGSSFENAKDNSFNGNRLITTGSVFFNDIKAKGEVRLLGANINGNLYCTGASFENGFATERTKIGDGFFLDKIERIDGSYNLAYMNVGQLVDDENSWPTKDNLILTGFEYKGFAGGNTPTEADKRIKWIRLQDKKHFSTQPYEHLAKVYRQIGHESDAREVLIAKQEDLRKYGKLSRKAKLWNWFLGETIGHGYKPIKSLVIIFLLITFGASMFFLADYCGVMQPSKERVYMSKDFMENRKIPPEYPKFYFPTYSMDVFVPFLDLHQEDYWLPDSSKPYGFGFRIYFWFHILCGWVFSTLTAASLTGLIRKE